MGQSAGPVAVLRVPQPYGVLDTNGMGRAVLPEAAGRSVWQPPALHCYLTVPNATGTAPGANDWVPITISPFEPLAPYCWVQFEQGRWVAYIATIWPGWWYLFVVVIV